MIVRAIREQNKHALSFSVDPAGCTRESGMAESVRGQRGTSGGTFCGGKLPGKRAGFIQAFRHILSKQFACFFRQQFGPAGNKLMSQTQSLARSRKQSRMARRATQEVRIAVMN